VSEMAAAAMDVNLRTDIRKSSLHGEAHEQAMPLPTAAIGEQAPDQPVASCEQRLLGHSPQEHV
jgi:hypothetical protein